MKKIRIVVIAIMLCVLLGLTGCSKSYKLYSKKVYLGGELLNGPALEENVSSLTLSRASVENGVSVTFTYYDNSYTGTIKDSYVLWNGDEPILIMGGAGGYTQIYQLSNGKIRMEYNCRYKSLWAEVDLYFE